MAIGSRWVSRSVYHYVFLFLLYLGGVVANDAFSISIDKNGGYTVNINNKTWLQNGDTFFRVNGRVFRKSDQTLILRETTVDSGQDVLGAWQTTNFDYLAYETRLRLGIKTYAGIPAVIFEQHYIDEAYGTSSGDEEGVISGFPSFTMDNSTRSRGYLSYGGMFAGETTKHIGIWNNGTAMIRDGIAGGPLVIFDKTGSALVISPFNQFMAASLSHDNMVGGSVSWGIMGLVDVIPGDFLYQTIVFYSDSGINAAMAGWGSILRKWYGKTDSYRRTDLAVNYLGYWTDNGAYYYYNTPKGKTYEDVILDVKKYADQERIPYRYVQYDSWWYFKGPLGGVTTWEAESSIFPRGLISLYNKTGWPVVAHNRYWSSKATYAKQNGGAFDFIVEPLKSLPVEQRFWDTLLQRSRTWGLITYEQDWLDAEFKGVRALLSNVTLGRTWLRQMGEAARRTGMTIQYCMAFPRHTLASLEIPTVTQIRVSDDYIPGEDQWKIGVTTIFAAALGLSPYKDTFWTTTSQPGNPYGKQEPYPELNAAVSVLSAGPVGPSDAVNYTNITLLMRCCNENGLILKPSRPIMAVDSQFIQAAFQDGSGPEGEVWSTYSDVSGLRFGIILAADMKNTFRIGPTVAGFGKGFLASRVYSYRIEKPGEVSNFSDNNQLLLSNCTKKDFCLYYTTPILRFRGFELLFLGELRKWVPVSPQRVKRIVASEDNIYIHLEGAPEEMSTFWFQEDGNIVKIICEFPENGVAKIDYLNRICVPW